MAEHGKDDNSARRAPRQAARIGVAIALGAAVLTTTTPSSDAARRVTTESEDALELALDHLVDVNADAAAPPGSRSKPAWLIPEEPELRVTATSTSVDGSVTHVYVQQSYAGIDIADADANVAVKDDEVVHAPERLLGVTALAGLDAHPTLDPAAAVDAAADALGLEPSAPLSVLAAADTPDRATTIAPSGIAANPIEVRLVWARHDKQLRLAWEVVIDVAATPDWWQLAIDADTGEELDRFNYNIHHELRADGVLNQDDADRGAVSAAAAPPGGSSSVDGLVADGSSYRVYPNGVESPIHGSRELITQPADDIASPFGWHDTDGIAGPESTLTTGNNVDAFTDSDGDNAPDSGSRPDGGAGLDFDFPHDLAADPTTQDEASVTQLFVSTNFAHDFLYAYGFDEASGNFQENNYGRGGVGNDSVLAEAQGTDATSNANFATPREGFAPRMQNFFWPGGAVSIDGAFDQGVVLHEYGHGLSVRLTGGPNAVTCLRNNEQGGEGWSDYVALMATMQPDDEGDDRRGIGTFVLRQSTNGDGIREYPYSTDFGVDPRTYGDIPTATVPHGVGSIWATMLWEMTWDLIDEHGLDPDVVRGTGGNNLAMQLMVDALKLQPCSPGFVDARDAILQADVNLTGGANSCLLWSSFARRGLGASATQGSADDHTDGIEAFDVPAECSIVAAVSASGNTTTVGSEATVSVEVSNNTAVDETNLDVRVELPNALDFVDGSADCNGTEAAGTVRLDVANLTTGASTTCSFEVVVVGTAAATVLADDFVPSATQWTTSNGPDTFGIGHADTSWTVAVGAGRNGSNAAYADGAHDAAANQQAADMLLTTAEPIEIPDGATLSFWHSYSYEDAYDGAVVELSTDGGASWLDLGDDITDNGYDDRISGGDSSPIAGRFAFTGSSGGFVETSVDLCRFSGESVLLRFRSATDPSITSGGWLVDDVRIAAEPTAAIGSSIAGSSGPTTDGNACVEVAASAVTDPPSPGPAPQDDPSTATVDALAATAAATDRAVRMPAG